MSNNDDELTPMLTIERKIDVTPGSSQVHINLNQYDSNFCIIFKLFARNGTLIVPARARAFISGKMADGTPYTSEAFLDSDAETVTVFGDDLISTVAGENTFELGIFELGGGILFTSKFVVEVEPSVVSPNTTPYINPLDAVVSGEIEGAVKSNARRVRDFVFQYCSGITSIELPRAREIGREAFSNCTGITSIDLPRAESIGQEAFSNCTGITSVELPRAKSIVDEAFSNCTGITSIDLPQAESIGRGAFSNCTGITSVKCPLVKSIEMVGFGNCRNIKNAYFPRLEYVSESVFYKSINMSIQIGTNSSEKMCRIQDNSLPPFFNGTIYVADSLVDSYKKADIWKEYANQIKGISEMPTSN